MKILIKNGKIWDGEKFIYSDILTEDQKIIKIDRSIAHSADFIFDAKNKIVSAGLIDIHTHLFGVSCDAFGFSADLCSIPFGVTTVADASAVQNNQNVLNSAMVKSFVFVCSDIKDDEVRFDFTYKMMKCYEEKVVGIKVYFDTTMAEIKSEKTLYQVVNFAEKNHLKVMVHTSNSPCSMEQIVRILRRGDILTHCFHSGKNNCTENNFQAFKEAQKKGVIMDAGMAGNVHMDFGYMRNSIANGFLPDTISSDITRCSAYTRGGRYSLLMCMEIAKKLGMKEEDVFRSVTSNASKALGKNCGKLSVGSNADIAVLDEVNEPFLLVDKSGNVVESQQNYKCVLTILNNQILYK